jgi:hypothetical protein
MKVIKQKNEAAGDISVSKSQEETSIKQHADGMLNWVICEKENTRELALSICPELAEEIERLKAQIHPSCFYQSDNTTAMNCANCGKPKFMHNT